MLQWFQPDLVLMNTDFPGFDGLQFTGGVRQATQYSQLPLLALTGKATPSDRGRALAAGFTDCILKPTDAAAFLLCLRAFLEKRQAPGIEASSKGPYLRRALDEFRSLANSQLQSIQDNSPEGPVTIRTILKQLSATAAFLNWRLLVEELGAAECLAVKAGQANFTRQIERCRRILADEDSHTSPAAEVKCEAPAANWSKRFSQLKANYLARLSSAVIVLREAVSKSDFRQIHIIGHNLKGSGAAYEFPQITEYGRDLEGKADACDSEGLRATVGNLSAYLGALKIP
jgi:CheY-like chemotaxis protein